jgi:2-succinyl-6-hydroxy-2,4-cyclohexadiene-1-carboxylate synthase
MTATIRRDGEDRWRLHRLGPPGRPWLALHGFTGGGEDWAPIAEGAPVPLLAPDLPGHGGTQLGRPVSVTDCADALGRLWDAAVGGPTVVVGYSLGGRTALTLALQRPDLVAGLVLIGASAGLRDEDRPARRQQDERLAAALQESGTQAFLEGWWRHPLIATQANIAPPIRQAMRSRRLALPPAGLADSLRGMGTGAMEPLWDPLAAIDCPALLVVGERDPKYRALATELAEGLAHAAVAVVPGVGHAAHLEGLDPFLQILRESEMWRTRPSD